MTFEALLRFVAKQQNLAGEVDTCYEAGASGYYLHRKLEALGVSRKCPNRQLAGIGNGFRRPKVENGIREPRGY